jgi:hypothetical protein
MAIVDDIRGRFQDNLARVRRMVETYESGAGKGKERRSVSQSDLLRAAVVILHATLKDLLRSLCEWKMPGANPEAFGDVPLVGTRGKTRFGLPELAAFRGKTVDDVVTRSDNDFLEKTNFNHPGDVKVALERIGVDSGSVNPHAWTLAAMMTRRHWIAHRADRTPRTGPGRHAASLANAIVTYWIRAVERFGNGLLSRL